ncbi:MAG TPA: glycosyltransferase family 4 protein [Gemmatimonadota bacterium]|nr:glycosyltransferase family 4 protein [Gemmatimonadota bacterium]
MRILHVPTAWPRDPGDVITPWLVTLAERQAERGHEVHVLAPSYAGLGDQRQGELHVHRYRYAPARWERLTHEETTPDRLERNPAWGLLLPGYVAAGTRAARRLGRNLRPDAVHVHWAIPHGVHGAAAARAARAALVTTFYGAEIRWAERRFPPGKAFLRWYGRRSHLVAISESTRRMLAPYALRPIDVIPYGVSMPGEAAAGGRAADPPILLFVGRLVTRKGVDRLLEALATLRDRPWRLEVIGFGPERERLEALAGQLGLAERVAFLGRVPNEELTAAYRRATAFVLPATLDEREDTEGLGVVLLEAMSHALPVVATRRGGITDVVIDGRTGILVEDEVPALAAGVRRLLEDPATARDMGERGRERVRTAFGWDSIVDRLEAVYGRGPVGA